MRWIDSTSRVSVPLDGVGMNAVGILAITMPSLLAAAIIHQHCKQKGISDEEADQWAFLTIVLPGVGPLLYCRHRIGLKRAAGRGMEEAISYETPSMEEQAHAKT